MSSATSPKMTSSPQLNTIKTTEVQAEQRSGARSPVSPSLLSPSSPLSDTFEKVWTPFNSGAPKVNINEKIQEVGSENDNSATSPTMNGRQSQFITQWPASGTKLSSTPKFGLLLIDLGLAGIPILFIIYGILAALLHNRPTASNYFATPDEAYIGSTYGPVMMRIQLVIPTLFQMAFGIGVTRLIKAFALWRAERGTRIGFIEQLISSTSLGGTVASLWGLRIINFVGLGLAILWSLAPIGSQAVIRIIGNNGTMIDNSMVAYMNTDAVPTGLSDITDDLQYYTYAVNAMYSTSVLTPTAMISPQDPWSNVKIPSLEWLQKRNGCGDDGWCSYPLARDRSINPDAFQVTAGTYTSLTGLPVVGGHYGLGFQNFTVDVSYYHIDCASLEIVDPSVQLVSALPSLNGTYNTAANSSVWSSGMPDNPNTFFLDTPTPIAGTGNPAGDARLQDNNLTARNIIFGSRSSNGTTIANCSAMMRYVEAEVLCNFTTPLWNLDHTSSGKSAAGACYVSRVRGSQLGLQSSNFTPLDYPHVAQQLFGAWPGATGMIPVGSSSPTERFINDTVSNSASSEVSKLLVALDWLGFNNTKKEQYVDIAHNLDVNTFTERFSLLFNTYWHSFCNLQAMTDSEIGLGFSDALPNHVMFKNTSVETTLPGQYYTVNFAYLGVYFFCAVIALMSGILALFVSYNTIVPDVLGSVSGLIRENPYIAIPDGGSALDGHELARNLMNMPVRFSDVRPYQNVGHIALTSLEDEVINWQTAPLTTARVYH